MSEERTAIVALVSDRWSRTDLIEDMLKRLSPGDLVVHRALTRGDELFGDLAGRRGLSVVPVYLMDEMGKAAPRFLDEVVTVMARTLRAGGYRVIGVVMIDPSHHKEDWLIASLRDLGIRIMDYTHDDGAGF